MAEENAKVNVQIPANRVSGILSLYQEWSRSRDATVEEMHRGLDGAIKAIERRIAFFDRLILLAGGSFALSLTFVSTLHKTQAECWLCVCRMPEGRMGFYVALYCSQLDSQLVSLHRSGKCLFLSTEACQFFPLRSYCRICEQGKQSLRGCYSGRCELRRILRQSEVLL